MRVYYNEIDPFAAAWLRELIKTEQIPDGEVDERSIVDVQPDDLRGFNQCHFFAGIGGWAYALRLAGWPEDREVWTGSCPCQPFSVAGHGAGGRDPRDLWPVWFDLIRECRPATVFGEQVEAAITHGWWDRCCDDLESTAYASAAIDLPACAVGANHARQRLYFVADDRESAQRRRFQDRWRDARSDEVATDRDFAFWSCRPNGAGVLDDGISNVLAKRIAGGFGNAIVPQVAQVFIEAFLEAEEHP